MAADFGCVLQPRQSWAGQSGIGRVLLDYEIVREAGAGPLCPATLAGRLGLRPVRVSDACEDLAGRGLLERRGERYLATPFLTQHLGAS